MTNRPAGAPADGRVGDAAAADLASLLGSDAYGPGEVAGHGRRGPTLRAVRRSDGRRVAIKVGPAIAAARRRKQFLDGAAALRRLSGLPGLAGVTDLGLGPRARPWLARPWFDGPSAEERLTSQNLRVGEVVEAARVASGALAALHARGLLHANLTPGCFLRDLDGDWWIDGVAVEGLSPDPTGWADGPPPSHVPPEVLGGSPWSVAGDGWALGSCLYTMLTGTPPWARPAAQGSGPLLLAMTTSPVEPPVRPDLPGGLAELVASCLRAEPAARPPMGAVAATIEALAPTGRPAAPAAPAGRPADPADPPGSTNPVEGGRPVGSSYLLDAASGAGASGRVWKARRRRDGTGVAVKVLRPELAGDSEAVARFLRERSALVGLDHPGRHRAGLRPGRRGAQTLAIVMELVDEARPACRLLHEQGPLLPPPPRSSILAGAAAGLAYVHLAGIVHRDLKPENMLA